MRKSSWIILVLSLFAAIGAPGARADSFTYSYTWSSASAGMSFTTAPIAGVTMDTTVPAADLTAATNSGSWAGCATTSVRLDVGGQGSTEAHLNGSACGVLTVDIFDSYAQFDYTTPGTYTDAFTKSTLVVTDVSAVPEPSSVAFMLVGIGFILVMRKRIAKGLPQAT
jgi:hypothetical protein